MKILVVEDDRTVAQTLELLFSSYHYAVDLAADGEAGLEMAEAFAYDLILLDVLLPKLDGVNLCQHLRAHKCQSPILLLTGQGGGEQKAIALNAGADDYVMKPFDAEELVARVQALLRRGRSTSQPILTWGHLSLNPNSRKVTYGTHLLELTPKEYAILELLLRYPQTVFSARAILDHDWPAAECPGEEAVRAHIKEMRQKFAAVGAPKDLIKTVYRVGYRINPLYSSFLTAPEEAQLTAPQIAELKSVNEELRVALEQVRSTQAELQQKNQELQTIRDELEQRVSDRTVELVQTNDQLRVREEQLRLALELTDTASWDWNLVTGDVVWSDTMFHLLGLRPGEATPHYATWLRCVHPEDLEKLEVSIPLCLQNQELYTEEYRVIHPDGSIRWLLSKGHGVYDATGQAIRMAGITLDISDRKQLENDLQLSKEQIQLALDLNAIGMWDWEIAPGTVTWNDYNYRLLDYEPGEVEPSYALWHDAIHPDDVVEVDRKITQALANQTDYVAEFRVELPDGSIRWLLGKGRGVYDEAGQPVRMIGVSFDISDRKQREANAGLLAEITKDLSRLSTADEILQAVGTKIGDYLNIETCLFAAINEAADQGTIEYAWQRTDTPKLVGSYRLSDFVNPAFQQVAQQGESIICCNTQTAPRTDPNNFTTLNSHAFVAVPFHRNGEWKYLLVVSDSIVRDWRDDEIELIHAVSNRTFPRLERARAEQALRASEAMLRFALLSAQAGTWDWDLMTGEVLWSPETYDLQGYTPADGVPEYDDWYNTRLHPDDRPLITDYMAHLLKSPRPSTGKQQQRDFQLEYRILHPQHGLRWLLRLGQLTVNEQGIPVRMSGILLDISDRKQAEITLQQQLARERLVADLSQEIRQSLDLDSVLSRTVERVRELLAADRVIIFRFRPNWQGDVIMESVGAEWTPILSTTISDPCFRDRYIEPYRQGRVSTISDINTADLEPCHVEFLQQFQVKANLVVPILQNANLWGLLISHECAAPRQWQAAEVDLLRQLATHVEIAIQQSELYQQTQDELIARERMQTVLEESEERFRTLSESAPIGICQTNPDGICLYTNTRWQEMSGLSAASCLGNGWLQAIHPGDRAAIMTAWEAYLEGGSDRLPEFRLLTPKGEIRWVAARVAAMRSATGEILGYVSTDEDITERKQAEEALLASEQRLQTILDYSPAAIYLIDSQNKYLLVNRRCAELLATTPEMLIGKRLDEVWAAPIADGFVTNNQQVLATRQLLQTEETVPHSDGLHSYLTIKFPLCDAEGIPYAVCGISTDITDKKRLEAQFHQAQRLESLGTLASGIAHDLNNVLTPILAIAQLLQLKQLDLDARSQEMLKVLEDSARHGADLVKQILTFTRGSEGKRFPVQVADLLTEVTSLVQKTFPKSITVQETLPANPPAMVLADATQLHQVLMNLCVNARDAMPDGGTLSLAVENIEINEIFTHINPDAHVGRYVGITIADTGTGIAPEVRDLIFDPFFTTKPFGQGTGLGLSTVLGIVRSLGGFVEVESELGAGSQFKIYLPALKTAALTNEHAATLPQGQGELILVVDDEEPILQSLREILETYNYQVLTATNGRDAIACYTQHQDQIHIVLIDMMMPELDGLRTIRALQNMNPQVNVIATSGLAGQYRQSLQALGITTMLTKPFTTAELLQSLTKNNGPTNQISPDNQA